MGAVVTVLGAMMVLGAMVMVLGAMIMVLGAMVMVLGAIMMVLDVMVTYWQRGHLKVLCAQCRSCRRRRSKGMALPQCEQRWCPGRRGSDSEGEAVGGLLLETTPLKVWPEREGEEELSDPEREREGGRKEGGKEGGGK